MAVQIIEDRLARVTSLSRGGAVMKRLLLTAALAAGIAAPVQAQTNTISWGVTGNWGVKVDPTTGHGCFATTRYNDGTMIRVGFSPVENAIYLAVANDKWRSIEPGEVYDLSVKFDDNTPWDAPSLGGDLSGLRYVRFAIGPEFIGEMAGSFGMEIKRGSNVVARLSLDGSAAALTELLNCQEAMDALDEPSVSSDPFTGSVGNDPFERPA